MARDRSSCPPPTPEFAELLGPDGSVIVPAAVAGEVLRLLVFALTERARSTGGTPSPTARRLLGALHTAAHRPAAVEPVDQADENDDPAGRDGGGTVTVREMAARMGCSPQYVRQLLAAGRLSGRRTAGGMWVIYPESRVADPQGPRASA